MVEPLLDYLAIDKERLSEIADFIEAGDGTFAWDSTPEGDDYWNGVVENLRKIANQKDVCEKCGQEINAKG